MDIPGCPVALFVVSDYGCHVWPEVPSKDEGSTDVASLADWSVSDLGVVERVY